MIIIPKAPQIVLSRAQYQNFMLKI